MRAFETPHPRSNGSDKSDRSDLVGPVGLAGGLREPHPGLAPDSNQAMGPAARSLLPQSSASAPRLPQPARSEPGGSGNCLDSFRRAVRNPSSTTG